MILMKVKTVTTILFAMLVLFARGANWNVVTHSCGWMN